MIRSGPAFDVRKRRVHNPTITLGFPMLGQSYRVRLLLVGAIVSCADANFRPVAAQLTVRETSLGVRPDGMVPRTIEISATMRLGYVVETPAGDAVVVDGVRGPLYSDINIYGAPSIALELRRYFAPGRRLYLTFSPDGRRFVSAAKQDDRALVTVDGIADSLFDAVYWDETPFSPDSRHVAYVATREGRYVVVRDGVVGPAYDAIRTLAFTTDSRHVSYVAQRDGREYVVMDGKELGAAERILGAPTFSVAFNRLAYRVKKGDSSLVVVDGIPGKAYRTIGERLQFTRDGQVVYSARDSLHYVVIGAVEGRGYAFIDEASVAISENGEDVSFTAFVNNAPLRIIGRRESTRFGWSTSPYVPTPVAPAYGNAVASPDGKRVASFVQRGVNWFIAFDGVVGPAADDLRYVTFSRDSRHVAYAAKRGDRWRIVVDSSESPAYDEIIGFPTPDHVRADSLVVVVRRGAEDLRVSTPWPRS